MYIVLFSPARGEGGIFSSHLRRFSSCRGGGKEKRKRKEKKGKKKVRKRDKKG